MDNNQLEKEIETNEVLSRVQNLLLNQTAKGVEKYGQAVQADNLSAIEWLDHASEEAADKLVYLQALRIQLGAMQSELEMARNILGDLATLYERAIYDESISVTVVLHNLDQHLKAYFEAYGK